MKTCTKCKIEKHHEDFYGNRFECKRCLRERAAQWSKAHPESRAKTQAKWNKANPKKLFESTKRWKRAHPEQHKRAVSLWSKAHPAQNNARNSRHRAGKQNATPLWANQFFIAEIYDLAQLRTKLTGAEWHVDHIVPLRSKLVSGLHVEQNLRVIPKQTNIAKGNRHWPDMPGV